MVLNMETWNIVGESEDRKLGGSGIRRSDHGSRSLNFRSEHLEFRIKLGSAYLQMVVFKKSFWLELLT